MSMRSVRDLLESKRREIFTIAPDATVQEALEHMVASSIGSLLVMQNNELVGILSERDYIRKAVPKRLAPWESKVRDIMTREVITVTPDHTIRDCMERMSAHRIRHLPVLDGRKVIGMLSISDVVRALRPARIDFPP